MVPPELDPTCQAARVWISAAIDGEATETERAGLRAHVAGCAACREWAALAESLALRVRTAEPAVPSRQLVLPPAPSAVPCGGAAVAAPARSRRPASPPRPSPGGVFTGTLGAGTPEQQHNPPERVMYVAIADTPVVGQPIARLTGRPQDR